MIEHLLKRREGENWVPVSAHASTKKFYKGNYEGSDALLIYFEQGEEERKRFVFLTKLLEKKRFLFPEYCLAVMKTNPMSLLNLLMVAFFQNILLKDSF